MPRGVHHPPPRDQRGPGDPLPEVPEAHRSAGLRALIGALWLLALPLHAAPPAAAIATAHPLATEAGRRILEEGGNAFDAAVAVAAALAVVEPFSSGLGGGGFWLLHRSDRGQSVMIDARERAPLEAHRDMYLDGQG
ncbi:MAG: hypothetical protein D6819_02600, partial [Gammaproteobacteria bacterium]